MGAQKEHQFTPTKNVCFCHTSVEILVKKIYLSASLPLRRFLKLARHKWKYRCTSEEVLVLVWAPLQPLDQDELPAHVTGRHHHHSHTGQQCRADVLQRLQLHTQTQRVCNNGWFKATDRVLFHQSVNYLKQRFLGWLYPVFKLTGIKRNVLKHASDLFIMGCLFL